MHTEPKSDSRRHRRLLTFARSQEAQLFAIFTNLTQTEADQLRAACDLLIEVGALALYRIDTPADEAYDLTSATFRLREHLGSLRVNAAITAALQPATPVPMPQTLIPLWEFEPTNSFPSSLTACGSFLGSPIVFEAIPLTDADGVKPVVEFADRFSCWNRMAGDNTSIGAVQLSGSNIPHAIFASVRPS
ncbi:hypothetical protein [Sphingomonas carotinifaciens]|uniref:hypothetical protein n=1 Tax=Sphingomonas carotinifaciens TaxID=1166323 RepID=UPI00123789CD|nr:hypothetical protein [Sphingomonas carotinifaciens]